MNKLPFAIQKIIDATNELLETGTTAASNGERIAAVLVLVTHIETQLFWGD